MTWTSDEVMTASDAWRWVPDEATTFEIDGVQVIDYPAWAFTSFYVTPLDTGLTDEQVPGLVERVMAEARRRGESSTDWWISPSTVPSDLDDVLVAAGGEWVETLDIYAYDMADGLPDVGQTTGVRTRLVSDERTLDDFAVVGDAVWGAPEDADERRQVQLAALELPPEQRDGWRVVGYLDGEPVAAGGVQVVDGVARLWGAATLKRARGRGAYRAVLRARLEVARERGASLGLVHARVGTSGPIVRRCGCTAYGQGTVIRVPVG